jgi:hypothetical protein
VPKVTDVRGFHNMERAIAMDLTDVQTFSLARLGENELKPKTVVAFSL